jgi:dipeptidase E
MKFLLTSAGIKNTSIHNALVDLLGKPIAESSALVISTSWYAYPGGLAGVYRLIRGVAESPLCEVGWKSLGVLELTALPSIKKENWVPLVQEVDALLVGGGFPKYLCYWMRQSGLADLLPELPRESVYVGLSGGSMVVTPTIGDYDDPTLPKGLDRMLGLVDFTLFPHLDRPDMPDTSLANVER